MTDRATPTRARPRGPGAPAGPDLPRRGAGPPAHRPHRLRRARAARRRPPCRRGPGPTSPGGAGEGATVRANRAAFERHQIVPRMLPGQAQPRPVHRAARPPAAGTRCCSPRSGRPGWSTRDSDLRDRRGRGRAWGCPTSCPTRAARRWRTSPRRWVGARGGSSSTGRPTSRSSTASWPAPRRAAPRRSSSPSTRRCSGWRPQDLNLGSLPFSQGIGIAQYTSDPRFQEIVARAGGRQGGEQGGGKDDVKVTLGALRSLLSISREHPGDLRANLRSPTPRAAVETFLDIYSNPGLTWEQLGDPARAHRPAVPRQGGPAPRRRPAGGRGRAPAASWSATTAAARSTARSPRSTPCPAVRAAVGPDTAGGPRQRRPHRQRRRQGDRPGRRRRGASAGPTSTAWPWPGGTGCATCWPTSWPSST